jgi:hypothetical protein
MSTTAPREPKFAILVTTARPSVVLQLMLMCWPAIVVTLNRPDDAIRLVQLREFLGGHGWFDLHMARLRPPLGYDPHWSRLMVGSLALGTTAAGILTEDCRSALRAFYLWRYGPDHPRQKCRWLDARLRIFGGRQHDQSFYRSVGLNHWARTACNCIAINSATGVICSRQPP